MLIQQTGSITIPSFWKKSRDAKAIISHCFKIDVLNNKYASDESKYYLSSSRTPPKENFEK